jgi:hypothetical protein
MNLKKVRCLVRTELNCEIPDCHSGGRVFWDVAARGLVQIDQRFGGAYCLDCQGG